MDTIYDVIIVGSGPAGLTAAIYTTRASLKTLVISGLTWGGQLMLTTDVENFPGFPEGIQGPDLMLNMRKQAERFGAEIVEADVDPIDFSVQIKAPFTVTANGKQYTGKTLLIATGENSKTLGVPGEKELTGRGISYCATCDGAFFRNKEIMVVGGGDSAMEEANFLTKFASKVILVHRRDSFRASQIMQDRVFTNPKIEVLFNTEISEVKGQMKVEQVQLKSKVKNQNSKIQIKIQNETKELSAEELGGKQLQVNGEELLWEVPIQGIFVAIGHIPNTTIFKGLELREGGYVKAQDGTRTNVKGVFVSGDVEDSRYRQAVTAAGFGCQAALDIERYLMESV